MTTLAANRTLALVLLHFLWQGALAAILLAAANQFLSRSRASARYAAACATLALMTAMPVATGLWLERRLPVSPVASEATVVTAAAHVSTAAGARASDPLARLYPWIVAVWLIGAGLLSLRAAGGWVVAARLTRRGVRPVAPAWEDRLRALAGRLGVRRPVRVLESLRVEVPSAIGAWRPVILIPAAMATGLTALQLDAILAHELAHVRRRDFLVNLLQVAAETLLFYHPAVWWVSARIRIERENACDDLAVAATQDPAAYARTLVAMEELRPVHATPGLAVALFGRGKDRLSARIARLFPSERAARGFSSKPLGAIVIAAVGVAIALASTAAVPTQESASPVPPAPTARPASPAPTARPARPATAAEAATAPGRTTSSKSPKAASSANGLLTPDQLVAFRIHGVTPEFIDEIEALGFTKLTPDDLIALRIHDVSASQIRQMKELFGAISLDECVAFKIHGVTPELVREYRSLGLGQLTADEAVAFRIHGVTPAYVREIRGLGYPNIGADELVAFRVHGVSPAYVKKMNASAGGRLSADDLIENRIFRTETTEATEKQDEKENP